jgi:hypothetical protein
VTLLAVAYCIASRLAYVLFTGIALRRQERSEVYTRAWGVERGFQRFRRVVSVLMVNDSFAFALLCLVTRDTIEVDVPRVVVIVVGAVLVAVGISVKVWAANTLGGDAYYWYNFFSPPGRRTSSSPARTGFSRTRCTPWATYRRTASR